MCNCELPGADLGFYMAGCPIHLKGAPEVERRRRRGGGVCGGGCVPSPENYCISYIEMVSLHAVPVIFIDTVFFQKGTLIKRAGVRTPWTPPGSAPAYEQFYSRHLYKCTKSKLTIFVILCFCTLCCIRTQLLLLRSCASISLHGWGGHLSLIHI